METQSNKRLRLGLARSQEGPFLTPLCLRRSIDSHSETVHQGCRRISHFGTRNVIPLTQIEMAGYFSSIFNYL
jgi:hypothetical protein